MLVRNLPPSRLPAPADVVLVVEVAGTTLAYDRNIKLPRYAAAGVPEVWLLNFQNDTIDVHSEPDPRAIVKPRFARGEHVESGTHPDLAFDADETIPPREPKPERYWRHAKGPERKLRPKS